VGSIRSGDGAAEVIAAASDPGPRLGRLARRVAPLVLVLGVAMVLAACTPLSSGSPGAATAAATAAPTAAPTNGPTEAPTSSVAPTPLIITPAQLKADPVSLLAWLFTPIFQAFLMLLVAIDRIVPDIGIAIILTTLLVRTLLVPLMRRQMVSMRQMQALGPEIKEIQRRYKNDRMKAQQAQSEMMRERGISQAGCLTSLLPLLLILPMYQVIREGLTATDVTPMLSVFGVQIIPLTCDPTSLRPCLDPTVPWLGGIDASAFAGFIPLPVNLPLLGDGISLFALVYTVFQLVASRLALPSNAVGTAGDQNAQTQRTMAVFMPLITILYGHVIPVGVFLYLIVSTIYQIVQQYLTTGWGGMFPLFGWTPAFAVDHKPRFPVAVPSAPQSSSRVAGAPAQPKPQRSAIDRAASANATIRQRGRQGRRGRRR
jgi:YidC/Oxa1 family membrane protein insertase